jgi:hypothetical protein
MEYADRLDSAVWNGWLQRATRLLADEPECIEQGWLELCLVRSAFERGEVDEGEQHALAAEEIGARFGDRDLVAFGRALEGAILVMHTQLEQGLSLVDEATLAAVGGELTRTAGNIYCLTIGVCRSVADYRRAGEWTEAASRWCEREAITGFPGICRVQRAEIMRLRGSYAEAEDEASKAQKELEGFGRLPRRGRARTKWARCGCAAVTSTAPRRRSSRPTGLGTSRSLGSRCSVSRGARSTRLDRRSAPRSRMRRTPSTEHACCRRGSRSPWPRTTWPSMSGGGSARPPRRSAHRCAAAAPALGATFTYEEDAAAAIASSQPSRGLADTVRVSAGAPLAGGRAEVAEGLGRPRAPVGSGARGLRAVRDARRCEEMMRR